MPIKINDITLQEPVQIKLDYKPVVLYDSESISGLLHRKFKNIKLFEDTAFEKDDIKFEQDYKIELFNITKEQYQQLKALDGQEVTLHIQRRDIIPYSVDRKFKVILSLDSEKRNGHFEFDKVNLSCKVIEELLVE